LFASSFFRTENTLLDTREKKTIKVFVKEHISANAEVFTGVRHCSYRLCDMWRWWWAIAYTNTRNDGQNDQSLKFLHCSLRFIGGDNK